MAELIKRQNADTVDTIDVTAVNSKDNRSLYAARTKIHPKRAKGFFRNLKWWIMIGTLGIYYLAPWLRWDRGIGAPDQAVLLDLANRRFYFFFIEIWPHEFYYVAGLLVMAGIGLFLITSILGRAWCGYACPQTIWVDLFLVVERFFEGDRNARIKLDKQKWNLRKITKRAGKHLVWIIISILTGGAWIFYFADAPKLLADLITGQALAVAYITIGILTATTYIFGGFMREQVCTYMCPWPRIQAAMLDENSLTVTYNAWRGEQRSKHSKKLRAKGVAVGDCVDCNACVAVCPMGIDIRDGQQLECITCGLCIDACDSVMKRLGLEKGLIAYTTLDNYAANMRLAGASGSIEEIVSNKIYDRINPEKIHLANNKILSAVKGISWRTIFRPRTYLYLSLYALIGLTLLTVLSTRKTLEMNVLHDRNPIFVKLSSGAIRNGYEIKILNMENETRKFTLNAEGLPGAELVVAGSQKSASPSLLLEVPPDKLKSFRVFALVPKEKISTQRVTFTYNAVELKTSISTKTSANFEAPEEYAK